MEDQKPLTNEQRFAIIEQMINTAQGKITDNSFQFLLWGWVIAIANLGHYVLLTNAVIDKPELIWMITFPAAIISAVYGYRQGRNTTATTYTDHLSSWIWVGFLACLITLVVFMSKVNFMINPLILLFTGYATFLSGITIKFRPLVIGAIVFWASAILGFTVDYDQQLIIGSIAVILGYLVPGYILKAKHRNG
jgi:hypothetical protein